MMRVYNYFNVVIVALPSTHTVINSLFKVTSEPKDLRDLLTQTGHCRYRAQRLPLVYIPRRSYWLNERNLNERSFAGNKCVLDSYSGMRIWVDNS